MEIAAGVFHSLYRFTDLLKNRRADATCTDSHEGGRPLLWKQRGRQGFESRGSRQQVEANGEERALNPKEAGFGWMVRGRSVTKARVAGRCYTKGELADPVAANDATAGE